MTPLVSILVPCYNSEPWIEATLESALAQTWGRTEIIVVNDGSTDGSRDRLRAFESRRVRVIDQPNAGQSAAFNRAITAAGGDYYEFLDADDLLAPTKIACQIERLRDEPADTIVSGRWGRFQTDPESTFFLPDNLWADLDPVEWLVRAWTGNQMMHGAAYLIPASVVRAAGGWCEKLHLINDFEFFSRLMLHSKRIVFCPEATTYYRSGLAGSLSGTKSPRAWKSAFESIELGTGRLLQREDSQRTRHACAAVWRTFIHDSYPVVPTLEAEAGRRVRALGEKVGAPDWGPKFRAVAAVVGWKFARRVQLLGSRALKK
jgi:glycosyltransferase involved in cell wall biosynthesis